MHMPQASVHVGIHASASNIPSPLSAMPVSPPCPPPVGKCLATQRRTRSRLLPPQEGGANPEDDSKFDEFLGNDAGALAGTGEYDEDDKEADQIWEAVDNFMDERRRVRNEEGGKEARLCSFGVGVMLGSSVV